MLKQLIIDVGMHKGEDAAFYLSRGFRVVGVEANPVLVAELKSKFADALAIGDLIIVDKAVSDRPGSVDFYINDSVSVWGSIDPLFVERNAKSGKSASQVIKVPSTTLKHIVEEFPEPYYVKIDVEGMDYCCLQSLSQSERRPTYVSIESSVSSPTNMWSEELALLGQMGYDRFKFVDQDRLDLLNGRKLEREGAPVVYQHPKDASGPFGDEAPGEWIAVGQAKEMARKLRREYEAYAKASAASRRALKMHRLARRLRGLPASFGWYDLHARRAGT